MIPSLAGGAFCVLVPEKPWAWVSETATVPKTLAAQLQRVLKQGPQAFASITGLHRPSLAKKEKE